MVKAERLPKVETVIGSFLVLEMFPQAALVLAMTSLLLFLLPHPPMHGLGVQFCQRFREGTPSAMIWFLKAVRKEFISVLA